MGCIEHTTSRVFYALAAAEGMLIYAFGDAPPPKQGLHILPDKALCDWWIRSKGSDPIPEGHMILVLAAMQGHPEVP